MTRENIPRTCEDTISDCGQLKAGGVCPFMITFMKGTCTKTCNDCSNNPNLASENVKSFIQRPETLASFHFARGSQRSLIENSSPRKFIMKSLKSKFFFHLLSFISLCLNLLSRRNIWTVHFSYTILQTLDKLI